MVKKNHVKHMQEKKHKDILLNIKNIEKNKTKILNHYLLCLLRISRNNCLWYYLIAYASFPLMKYEYPVLPFCIF